MNLPLVDPRWQLGSIALSAHKTCLDIWCQIFPGIVEGFVCLFSFFVCGGYQELNPGLLTRQTSTPLLSCLSTTPTPFKNCFYFDTGSYQIVQCPDWPETHFGLYRFYCCFVRQGLTQKLTLLALTLESSCISLLSSQDYQHTSPCVAPWRLWNHSFQDLNYST